MIGQVFDKFGVIVAPVRGGGRLLERVGGIVKRGLGVSPYSGEVLEKYHKMLVDVVIQTRQTASILSANEERLKRLAIQGDTQAQQILKLTERIREVNSTFEKILEREKVSKEEAEELVTVLEQFTGALEGFDKTLEVNLSDLLNQYKELLRDERIAEETRKEIVEEVKRLVEETKLTTDSAKAIVTATSDEFERVALALEDLAQDVTQEKIYASLRELNRKFDTSVLENRELRELLESQVEETKSFKEAFLEHPELFSVGREVGRGLLTYAGTRLFGPLGGVVGALFGEKALELGWRVLRRVILRGRGGALAPGFLGAGGGVLGEALPSMTTVPVGGAGGGGVIGRVLGSIISIPKAIATTVGRVLGVGGGAGGVVGGMLRKVSALPRTVASAVSRVLGVGGGMISRVFSALGGAVLGGMARVFSSLIGAPFRALGAVLRLPGGAGTGGEVSLLSRMFGGGASLLSKVFGGGVSVFPRILGGLGRFARFIPGAGLLVGGLLGAFDFLKGVLSPEEVTGGATGILPRIGAGLSSLLSGLTLGLISPQAIYGAVERVFGGGGGLRTETVSVPQTLGRPVITERTSPATAAPAPVPAPATMPYPPPSTTIPQQAIAQPVQGRVTPFAPAQPGRKFTIDDYGIAFANMLLFG